MTTPQDPRSKFTSKKFLKSFVSGGLAGIAAKSTIAPFERVKILFLVRNRKFTYQDAINDAKYIWNKHGIKSFWRGNSANILRIFPYAAIQFSTYDYYRMILEHGVPEHRTTLKKIGLFMSGALAGITASLITYPLEFLRTRLAMQRDNFSYKNILNAVKIIKEKEGVLSFYSGLAITLVGIVPYHGVGFFSYQILKGKLRKQYPRYGKHPFFDFIFGGFSGIVAQIISYPFDVLRKRMQAQKYFLMTGELKTPRTTYEMFRFIVSTEGVQRGLYKGITMNLFKAPLAVGTVWTVKNALNRYMDKDYDL